MVGRIVKTPELKQANEGKKVSNVTIAVPRSYKNSEGIYETDFIDCTLWDSIASSTSEYCKKGDLIGIKGRLQTREFENPEGKKVHRLEVIADKVTFLSCKKENEEEIVNEEDLDNEI